jgi:hypothetical protein
MKTSIQPRSAPAVTPLAAEEGFFHDLRAFLRPEKKWHYVFHLVVLAVAAAYWIGSLLRLPEASWAEILMYRPDGDNQLFPVITALSKLNFGDPTDVVNYGRGLGGFQAIILLPHALAWAIFGPWGYVLADVAFAWIYFAALVIFLRRCNCGSFASLLVGSALATGSLQRLSVKLGESLAKLLVLTRHALTEWDVPPLLGLPIFEKRIPRALITEILVVLLLYFLFRLWHARRWPALKQGIVVGGLMALLVQGDPYSFSALGLLLLAVVARTMAGNGWRFPWPFAAGGGLGAVLCGWFFVVQQALQSHECAVRFGLAPYSRLKLLPLPGYGPVLRVAVIALLAWIVCRSVRRWQSGSPNPAPESRRKSKGGEPPPGGALGFEPDPEWLATARSLAGFCVALVAAGWLAQPVQLFLLGQGAEIFHYFYYTLPTLYAYALVLLLVNLLYLAAPAEWAGLGRKLAHAPQGAGSVWLVLVLVAETVLGIDKSVGAVASLRTAREEVLPWVELGDTYRPAFRALDKQFRENPTLQQARSFATLCHEVNFLLTAFHGKRAYLPDNGYTTLGDDELERRLCEMGRICGLTPERFAELIQNTFVLNYWLGCAKYWCATDYKFAPESEYAPGHLDELSKLHKESPFNLVLPKGEFVRIIKKYEDTVARPADRALYPDVIIMTVLLKDRGMFPQPGLYQQIYNNEVFWVYAKKAAPGK